MTTRSDIRKWFYLEGRKNPDHRFMLIVTDTFDFSDYPVFVTRSENVEEALSKYQDKQALSKVMECYDLDLDPEPQIAAERCWNTGQTSGEAA